LPRRVAASKPPRFSLDVAAENERLPGPLCVEQACGPQGVLGRTAAAGRPTRSRSKICRKANDYIHSQKSPQDILALQVLSPGPPGTAPERLVLVLDTNVVLDWLLFGDASCAALAAAVTAGRVRWLASPAMRDELQHVLGRGLFAARLPDPGPVLEAWDRWVTPVAAAPPRPPLLRSSHPDDQKFRGVALAGGASALLSRDRAVLKLARRARRLGLEIRTAADWRAP
jgi:predicted nucleic acid-binding protein